MPERPQGHGGKPAPQRHRRSSAETFGCPKRYRAIVIDGLDDTGDEATRGRFFHVAVKLYVLRLAAERLTSDRDEARTAFVDAAKFSPLPDHLFEQCERLFLRWAEGFELDLDAYFSAEQQLDSDDREFRPDLVYCHPGVLEVIDWKTYYKGLTKEQAASELQLKWYLVEAKKRFPGFALYRFSFVFVRLHYTVSLDFTPEQVDEFELQIEARIAAIDKAKDAKEFPPLPGSHCGLCRLVCDAADDRALMPKRYQSIDAALTAYGRWLVLERELKAIKAALRAFVQLEGPMVLNGQLLTYKDTESKRYPAQECLDILKRFRIQHQATISASGIGVKKLAPTVTAALDAIAIRKTGYSFRHKKFGEVHPDGFIDLLADPDAVDGEEIDE
jgi:hypothetical protein